MDEQKRINRQFTITYIIYIGVFIGFIALAFLLGFWITDMNIEFVVFLGLIIALMIVSVYFKSYLDRIQNVSYLIKIMRNASGPIELDHMQEPGIFEAYVRQKGFTLYGQGKKHKLFYKVDKDHIKNMSRRFILQVIVILDPSEPIFFNDKADEDINKLNQELLKKRMKVSRMLITQIKSVEQLDESTKNAIKEVVFFRSKKEIISVINVGIHKPSNKAVLLYSDTYSPSLYYKYHVEQLKSLI